MNYKVIRDKIPMGKMSRRNDVTELKEYGDFCVMKSSNGGWFIVDNMIAKSIFHRRWRIDACGYVSTDININDKNTVVRLHDYVLSVFYDNKPDNSHVDHINGCKTDNRKCNLRIVTPSFNLRNVRMRSNNTSGINGVSKARNGKWRAYITVNQKQISLGTYSNINDAIVARYCAEEKLGFCHTVDMEKYISSKTDNGIIFKKEMGEESKEDKK